MPRFRLTTLWAAAASVTFVAVCCAQSLLLRGPGLVDVIGWAIVFVIGLAWAVYGIELAAQRIETARAAADDANGPAGWNPLDPAAVFYQQPKFWLVALLSAVLFTLEATAAGLYIRSLLAAAGDGQTAVAPSGLVVWLALAGVPFAVALFLLVVRDRLRQSLAMLVSYSFLFGLLYLLAHLQFAGASEGYDLPSGGGNDSIQASAVKVQKVVRKKFVINPYSSIIFSAPPPIDQIDVKLMEETQNRYVVGQGGDGNTGDGDGDGSGFGSGTGKGKAAFVRLKHGDKGWDRNFGIGGDRNMLSEYHARTKQKVADETEYLEAGLLANMPRLKNPSLLYISGNGSLPLSAADKKNLKEYLTERHGMILGDNHGGPGFHHHFMAMMNEITGVTPVAIPRDDMIHQRPYSLPQLPIVVAHGPPTPLGWKIDGRWAVYYHPGALSDAWRDDHAGIKKDVYESCYQLGVNVMFYSMKEKSRWLQSQKP